MKRRLLIKLFIWTLHRLRRDKSLDVRMVYDVPKGTVTFQGTVRYE